MIKRIIAAIVIAWIMMCLSLSIIGLILWGVESVVMEIKFYTGCQITTVWSAIGIITAIIAVILFIGMTISERKKK